METKEITPLDVFELLKIIADGINLDEIKPNQKHPDRKRFVYELV